MPIALRHREQPAIVMSAMPGLAVHRELDARLMAALQQRALSDIQVRFDAGHRAYVATMDGVPAAWGWVATTSASIGELQVSFPIASRERYLWNFVTLPAFRGRGIYPRLLEAIIAAESVEGERFWIAYAPENHASGVGIRKAGFAVVAELSFDLHGRAVVKDIQSGGGESVSRLLGLPDTQGVVSQCWKCARGPVPGDAACESGHCSCDYQRAEVVCAG
ncbi:MAG: GNAT family N-acetyltransferase [Gemmatimonadaceae bacterium]